METAKIDIKQAVIKKDRLNVVYNERFTEANYTNKVTKNCDQIVHSELKEIFNHLKLHLVVLCEQPEAEKIHKSSFTSPGFVETLNNYFITGYANDSNDGVPGITIMGGKLLQSGKIVDLKIFTPFGDEEYKFSEELQIDAAACDAEVEAYLFEEKWGIKQERLDFDSDIPDEAVTDAEELPAEEEKPKRKGRKTKTIAPAA